MREVRDVKTTDIWDKYQKGKDHHNRVHMYIDVEKEHAFYEGDQWRYAKTGGEEFTPDMLAAEIRVLNHELDIPPTLNEVGVTSDKFEQMADDAMKSGNIQVNP